MTERANDGISPNHQPENCRRVEVRGQVRAVQMAPPTSDDEPEGGTFELLLDNGDIITSPYPAKWHIEVAGAFQANDILTAVVAGLGEYSADGRLLRISKIEAYGTFWRGESQPPVMRRI